MTIKKIVKLGIGFVMGGMLNAYAGGPAEPAHMPNAPMPAFNLFEAHTPLFNSVAIHSISYHQHQAHQCAVTMYPGSLKNNLIRIARAYGWKHIIWSTDEDYHWIGKIRVAANDLPDILGKILKDYPLQADFYNGNHVLVIKPRTLQA